jgi:hypothetical protein
MFMPKKDPVTGCNVSTEGEFWNKLAEEEGEGKKGWELREEYFDEMQQELEEHETSFREPANAFDVLKDAIKRYNEDVAEDDPKMPQITEVFEVLDVEYGAYSLRLRVRGRREDGVEDILEFFEQYFPATRIDPGDYESEIFWENLDDEMKPIVWKRLWNISRNKKSPESDPAFEHRNEKAQKLYKIIKQGGVRTRIHDYELEVEDRDGALKAIGYWYFHNH